MTSIKFDFIDTYYLEYGMGRNATPMVCNFDEIITSVVTFKDLRFLFGSRKKPTIYIRSDEPVPLGIRGIYPEVTYYE